MSVEEIELRKSTYPHIGISQNSPIQSPSRMLSFAAEVQMRGGRWAGQQGRRDWVRQLGHSDGTRCVPVEVRVGNSPRQGYYRRFGVWVTKDLK